MRECNEYEVTVEKLLNIVHRSTERIQIRVVSDFEMCQDKVKLDFITTNFSENQEEIDRVLKYYKDVPCWNLHVEADNDWQSGKRGTIVISSIVANVHYKDMREGYLREKEDIRKEKAREYRRRRKEKEKR